MDHYLSAVRIDTRPIIIVEPMLSVVVECYETGLVLHRLLQLN